MPFPCFEKKLLQLSRIDVIFILVEKIVDDNNRNQDSLRT